MPRIISETKIKPSNSILNYLNVEQGTSSTAINSSDNKLDNLESGNSSIEKTRGTRQRGKTKSSRTTSKTRKKESKPKEDDKLTFKKTFQRIREREEAAENICLSSKSNAEDILCDESEKKKYLEVTVEKEKENWSRVRKFGKDLRSRKKKSLSVSIESKSHNTPCLSNQNIKSAEVDFQDIRTPILEKKPLNLDQSLSDAKEEECLISQLSTKEVNDIIGVMSVKGSEISLTPENRIHRSSDESDSTTDYFKGFKNNNHKSQKIDSYKSPLKDEMATSEQTVEFIYQMKNQMQTNVGRVGSRSSDQSDSTTEYFKEIKNNNRKAQRIISDKSPLKDAKNFSEETVEDSDPEEEEKKNLLTDMFSRSFKKQCSDVGKTSEKSSKVEQMSTEVKAPSSNEFSQMEFTLPVISGSDKKGDQEINKTVKHSKVFSEGSERLDELVVSLDPYQGVSQGSLNPKAIVKKLPSLASKGSPAINHGSSREKSFEIRKIRAAKTASRESLVLKENEGDIISKSSNKKQCHVPFKKLGKIFKPKRRIPFYYLGRVSREINVADKSNLKILSPTQWRTKHSKKNVSTSNLSDSGFSRTKANLSPESSRLDVSIPSSHRSSGTVVLLSPHNDSQLKHLSIGSPHKEEASVLNTSPISGKNNIEIRENCSSLKKQNSFTPKARKNISENFEPLQKICEEDKVNEWEVVQQEEKKVKEIENQDYKKLLDGTDFEIDTEQFKEFDDIPEIVSRNPEEVIQEKLNLDEPKLLQDTDSGSVIPSSLDRSSKKLFVQPFVKRSNFGEGLERNFEYSGISQQNVQVESQDIASRFFEDVIEKSKHIRVNTSVDNIEFNPQIMQPYCEDIKSSCEMTNEISDPLIIKHKELRNEIKENSKEINSKKNKCLESGTSELLDVEPLEMEEKKQLIEFPSEIPTEILNPYISKQKESKNHSRKESIEEIKADTYALKANDNLEADKENRIKNFGATETDKDEETLHAFGKRVIDSPRSSLMNITEEQLLFNEFEKELFAEEKTKIEGEDIVMIADLLKTPSTSNTRIGNTNSKRQRGEQEVIETIDDDDDDDDEIIENTPKDRQKVSQKMQTLYEEDCPDFSPIPAMDSSTSENATRPFLQPSVKRKSCPLYHSTPKVPRTKVSERCATSLDGKILLSSLQKPSKLSEETIRETTVAKPKLTFVCSGLSNSQIEVVKKLAKLVNADFTSLFNANVTHVIVKVSGPRNAAEKTLKYIQGIAYGKWIVSVKWAFDSLRESKLLNEEKYEAVDNLSFEEGPKKSRLRKHGIFDQFMCLCQGPFSDVSIEEYRVRI